MPKLSLPTVTLCAVASVNVAATLAALRESLGQVEFGHCLFFTDATDILVDEPAIEVVPIRHLTSASAYSDFILSELVDYLETEHCLIVQWDGFVVDAGQWRSDFLDFDYIGAAWPHFGDGHDVGNGGFSLRSRKLLEACRDPRFISEHPEDVAICRSNRTFLEQAHQLRFAPRAIADQFSFERAVPPSPTFGFHGVFNMIKALGTDRFWEIYQQLDYRASVQRDYPALARQLLAGGTGVRRVARLTTDCLKEIWFG